MTRFYVIPFITVFASLSFASILRAQSLQQRLESAYRTFETHESLSHGIASLTVVNGHTGDVVFAKNEHVGLATASTLKNITAATAYHLLGSDYVFNTSLYYTGQIDPKGVLHGDIIIKGVGDPTLGSDRYPGTIDEAIIQNWTAAIQSAGIQSVQGRVIGHDNRYGGTTAPRGWAWQDMGNYYGAGVSSLNWQENSVGVDFGVGNRVGAPTTIKRTTSDISYLTLANETTTGRARSGDNVYAFAAPYASRIYLRGTHGIDLRKTIRIALPDPAYHVARQLHKSLETNRVSIDGDPTTAHLLGLVGTAVPDEGVSLYEHQSPALDEIVYWFNQKSINLYGEALLMAMAHNTNLDARSTSDGATLMRDFWVERLGIAEGELRIHDGSGLSPGNRVTTRAMTRILSSVRREPWFDSFFESIPINNGIRMKSGTIGGVLGYAGYHTDREGTPLVFVLLVNNYQGAAQPMRNRMFRLLNTLKE